jgi:hypothetical protein
VCKITSISFAFPASVTATNLPTAIEQRCRVPSIIAAESLGSHA